MDQQNQNKQPVNGIPHHIIVAVPSAINGMPPKLELLGTYYFQEIMNCSVIELEGKVYIFQSCAAKIVNGSPQFVNFFVVPADGEAQITPLNTEEKLQQHLSMMRKQQLN